MAHETRPRTLDPAKLAPLPAWLADRLGAEQVVIEQVDLLSGGAIGENWRLKAAVTGGPRDGVHDWVLRTDAATRMAMSHDRAHEFACIEAAHAAGVRVPEPIAHNADDRLLGAPFMIVGHIGGYARGDKLVRDPDVEKKGDALAEALGAELAKIHAIRPPRETFAFLTVPEKSPALVQVEEMRGHLDAVSEPHPALEYALCWLEDNAPGNGDIVLCHGDFRTGNYMVENGRLTGLLDWEFCHWGDRHLDIGWLCARCWRFGADEREAGGVGAREAFYRGYNRNADKPLDESQVPYWEVLAAARWAVIALLQGERHITGGEPSVELLLTGIMAPEMEYDALEGITAIEQD